MIAPNVRYITPNGTLTVDGLALLADLDRRLRVAEGKLTAIAAIAEPTGGAVIDAEARAAIAAILA